MENTTNLYSWFEKSGIISNVRTHLRQNLINVLKNRDLDLKKDNAPKSAKQYIYDLLIAEYLFNHNYAYTLSVFASEAPMLVNFPNNVQSSDDQHKKLQEDYIIHTLETLGINPNSTKGSFIISQYIREDTPLLLCIFKSLTMSFTVQTSPEEESLVSNKHTQTEDPRKLYKENEAKLTGMKKRIIQQKKTFDNELKRRETILKEQAVIVDEQLKELNDKFDKVQTVMRAINIKEKELNDRQRSEENALQKHLELTCKEKQLLIEANRKFEEDLFQLQEQLTRVQKELPLRKVFLVKTAEVQTEMTIDLEKETKIQSLTKEKEELKKLVEDQQLRLEQITQRALQLSRQVEDIHLLRPTSDTETPMKTVNTIISETSSTEDILQDAKSRLRRLEEESLKADQYYYKFINATS